MLKRSFYNYLKLSKRSQEEIVTVKLNKVATFDITNIIIITSTIVTNYI
jgi:hypothetical protein